MVLLLLLLLLVRFRGNLPSTAITFLHSYILGFRSLPLCACVCLLLRMWDTLHFMLSLSMRNSLTECPTEWASFFPCLNVHGVLPVSERFLCATLNISISLIYSCLACSFVFYIAEWVDIFMVHAWAAAHFSTILQTHILCLNCRQNSEPKERERASEKKNRINETMVLFSAQCWMCWQHS